MSQRTGGRLGLPARRRLLGRSSLTALAGAGVTNGQQREPVGPPEDGRSAAPTGRAREIPRSQPRRPQRRKRRK